MLSKAKSRIAGRKLKLQVQMTVDGFIGGGVNGELDWMTWELDDKLKKYILDLHDSVDTILLDRKMTLENQT